MALAALDLGTNSTRVLVARHSADGGLETLARANTITRLGQGVSSTGRLSSDAIQRTVDCVRDYRSLLDEQDVDPGPATVRVAATSAARDAANRDELFDQVESVLGARPELLTGEEEGRLAFQGATSDLDPTLGPFLVVDIGGGSTEFIAGRTVATGGVPRPEVQGVVSVDIGCVRLTEAYVEHDPPMPEELSAAISVTDAHLEDVLREVPDAGSARTLVGLAGTITTAAAVELGLQTYDRDKVHHFRLAHAAAEDVFRTLVTEARADRIHNPGLEEARADVIVGGMCILVAIYRRLGFEELIVSEADILDGLVFSLADRSRS